jgi:hypothetical protein
MENNLKIMFLDTRPVRRGAQVFVHELKKQFETAGSIVQRIFLYKEVHFECQYEGFLTHLFHRA